MKPITRITVLLFLVLACGIAGIRAEEEPAVHIAAGCFVTFGRYEQDNDPANGPEPIEWLVLDYDAENNRALLLSRYGLDARPYHGSGAGTTWEKCALRAWLNGDFLREAFSPEEQSAILITKVDNGKGQGFGQWNAKGGKNTQDRVFLLSFKEANTCLGVTYEDVFNTVSRTAPTAYALERGAYTNDSDRTAEGTAAGWWWLRSPGIRQRYAAMVYTDGSLIPGGVDDPTGLVRPALWLDLGADVF